MFWWFSSLLNLLLIRRHCSHKFITGKKMIPLIPRFLQIFSVANISCFLIFSSLSLFLIHSGFVVRSSLGIPDHRGGALHQKSSLASLTAQFLQPWFGQGVFFTLFVVLLIPLWRASGVSCSLRLLVLYASLDLSLKFWLYDRMRSSDSLLNSHILLFDDQLLLVLLLINVGGGEEKIV